jgi:cytochrome c oxidase accessory protein FixG
MMSQVSTAKVIPIKPIQSLDTAITIATAASDASVSLYVAHQKIHPRQVDGFFATWRVICVWLTQAVFYGLPWLMWHSHSTTAQGVVQQVVRQAILFDIDARRFYMFNLVLYPQDFIYLTGLLVICALSLFLFTAIAGRLWCGYACPQTVYTQIFLWIEQHIEGNRQQRQALDEKAWSLEKFVKKTTKHLLWLMVAFWTGFTFVGYFTPIHQLSVACLTANMASWSVFWVVFYGFATYGNAGFMREQVCKYMCPYARFQSAMFDQDTLIVTYDAARGEPRKCTGARTSAGATVGESTTQSQGDGIQGHSSQGHSSQGQCIDCTLCVQVCPVGIDIRQGLQYECISCGACADVCDTVMTKIGAPLGLIRYTTAYALQQGLTFKQQLRRVFRPRVLIYSAVLTAIVIGVFTALVLRTPFKVDVVHDRGALSRRIADDVIENVYRMQLMNATEQTQTYHVQVQGFALDGRLDGTSAQWKIASPVEVVVAPTASRWVAVRVQLHAPSDALDELKAGGHPIQLAIRQLDDPAQVTEKASFMIQH